MLICICRLVSRTEIEHLLDDGLRTLDQVGAACDAGTDCGKCRRNIQRILDAYVRPVEPIPREPHQS